MTVAGRATREGRAVLLGSISERVWQRQVITWACRAAYSVYHVHDSRTQEWGTDSGFPDLVLCKPGRLLFVELKTQRGRLTSNQTGWLRLLESIPGIEVYTWRPSDEQAVREILR